MTTILVVEDESSFSEALEFLLGKEGFSVVLAATGNEAMSKFDQGGIDLVLLDLMIPGFSGIEVCKQIRSCLLYTSPSPRDKRQSRMPSSA